MPDANILGMVHSNDSATLQKFTAASQGVIGTTKPQPTGAPTVTTSTASATVGSVAQLSHVEAELKAKPAIPVPTDKIPKPAKPSARHVKKTGHCHLTGSSLCDY